MTETEQKVAYGITAPQKECAKYIRLISAASDRYGDKLVALMDKCGVSSTRQITTEQAKAFYEKMSRGEA